MNNKFKDIVNLIIIDSNFILLPIQFHVDYIEEIAYKLEGKSQFIIYKQIYDELNAKRNRYEQKKSSIFQNQYSSGLKYLDIKKENFDILIEKQVKDINENTDDFLLRKASEFKGKKIKIYLATNDSELRKKAIKLEISVIFLRQKKYISIEGY